MGITDFQLACFSAIIFVLIFVDEFEKAINRRPPTEAGPMDFLRSRHF